MSYQGFYLNLDRSADRRAEMERELARAGLADRYRRVAAIDGQTLTGDYHLPNRGAVGCFLSHVAACREAIGDGLYRHIIEDDVIFAASAGRVIDWVIASGMLDQFDILMTDFDQPLLAEKIQPFKYLFDSLVTRGEGGKIASASFQAVDLRESDFASATSYLVNKNSVAKLLDLFQAEIDQGIRLPVDDFYRLQARVGAIRVGCVFPFVTAARVEHALDSTIRATPDTTRRFTARNLARYSFFIDCDWRELDRLMDEHIPSLDPEDRHAQALARLLSYPLGRFR